MLAREPRVQPPALEALSDVPLFNTKAVVHQTSVPAPTLRAWERRYGILAPRRGENDYRLYSERDIATVTWLRERVESGMTISQAIALLRSLEPARRRGRRATQPPAAAPITQPLEPPARLALDEMVAALLQSFKAFDELAAKRTIMQALAVYTLDEVCLHLFTPALHEVGRLWAAGQLTGAVEHFATALIRGQLESLYHVAGGAQSGPLVLVGCAPGELHEIGALMLALFLRRAGLHVAYLGQSVEPRGLVSAAQSARPTAVLLSATMPAHVEALVGVGEAIRQAVKPSPLLFFGGQGCVLDAGLAGRVPLDAVAAAREIRKRITAERTG